jgi:TonB-linked SusC/RagA family outer membrane protein
MKIKLILCIESYNNWHKILLKMKLTLLLLMAFVIQASATVYSQSVKFNFDIKNEKVSDVLQQIESNSNFRFFYQREQVDVNRMVDLTASDNTVEDILNKLFDKQDIGYKVMEDNLILLLPAEYRKVEDNGSQQQLILTGKVTDAGTGEAMAGVNIIVKGTVTGTLTDSKGMYTLSVTDMNATLIFSFIGYVNQEVPLNGREALDIALTAETRSLDEVVVVGYGAVKKANLTGAVASVNGKQIIQRPVTSTGSMLQGLMSGVEVTQGSGEPGAEGISIRIRGLGTFSNAGSAPLVLIDGVQGALETLDPNNIESISVLKDAASASIYGARAANGVILVTTKTGKKEGLNIEYNVNYGIHVPTFMFKLITNSAEYMELYNEASINSGLSEPSLLYTQETIDLYRNATDRNKYPNTDWLSTIFDTAPTQTHYLSLNGGNEITKFNISLGYVNEMGTMKGFNNEKYNALFNISSQINKKIKFGAIVSLNNVNKSSLWYGSQNQFICGMSQAPEYAPKLSDGSGRYTEKAFSFEYVNANPVWEIENNNNVSFKDYTVNSQLWFDVQLLKGLTWYTKGALNAQFNKFKGFNPDEYNYNWFSHELTMFWPGEGSRVRDEQNIYSNLYTYLNFDHSFNNGHAVKAQVGYSMEANAWQYLQGTRRIYLNQKIRELDAGSPDIQSGTGTMQEWSLMSFFGRLGYTYKDRYLLEANLRYDGSSRLSPSSRWGLFPSFSAAWKITEENFVKDNNLTWLNNLKIRGSYGQLGNQNIGIYPYQPIIDLIDNYSFNNENLSVGAAQTRMNNPDIKWETTTITDFGIDLMVFKGVSMTFDWYKKRTKDILRSSQVTDMVGLTPPTVNDGILDNTGVELSLAYNHNIKSGFFSGLNYNIGLNLEHYKNKLIQFGQPEIEEGNWAVSSHSINQEGYEWNAFYMLKWIGIFQSEEEIASSPKQYNDATVPGDLKWEDANGDNVINDEDRIIMPGKYPKLNYGFNFSANFKGFDFYTLFQGVQSIKFYVERWGIIPFTQGTPPTTDWRNRWTETNHSTTMPRIYYMGWASAPDRILRPSSWYLHDASYLRLKTLSFGYTVPNKLTKRVGIDQLRFYFSGDNLITITKFHDLDPERVASGWNSTWNPNYPQNKVYSFGINVKF